MSVRVQAQQRAGVPGRVIRFLDVVGGCERGAADVSMRKTTSSGSREICSAEQRGCAGTEGNHEGGNGARAESRTFPLSSGASRSTRGPHPPTAARRHCCDNLASTQSRPALRLHAAIAHHWRTHACAPLQSFTVLKCVRFHSSPQSLAANLSPVSAHTRPAKPYQHAKRLRTSVTKPTGTSTPRRLSNAWRLRPFLINRYNQLCPRQLITSFPRGS